MILSICLAPGIGQKKMLDKCITNRNSSTTQMQGVPQFFTFLQESLLFSDFSTVN